jgi:hypothetical protein
MVFSPMNIRALRTILKSEVLLPPVKKPISQSFQSGFAIRHAPTQLVALIPIFAVTVVPP